MSAKSSLLQISRLGFRLRAPNVTACTAGLCRSNFPPHAPAPCSHSYCSNVKVRSYLQYMKHKIRPPPSPPYGHVCQVGDPVLRSHAATVDPAAIKGDEIQQVIKTMVKVMRKLDCVGLSAPQVGVPLRILALEYPEKMLQESTPASREFRGLSAQPLRIFINPQLRVLDGQTVIFQEACESITGFSAAVPRYRCVEVSGTCAFGWESRGFADCTFICKSSLQAEDSQVYKYKLYCSFWTSSLRLRASSMVYISRRLVLPSGLNEKGEGVKWQASGWPARILQHEMDHLDGVLYIDRMDSKTFINVNWQAFNE